MLIAAVAPAASQTVTAIEFPGAKDTRPHGINSSGEISGIYINADNSVHSFLLDHKGFTTIDVPGAIGTNALRINAQGDIVGFYVPSAGTGRGFVWRRGTFSDIAAPGTVLDFGNGINARGDIVGQYNDTPGIPQHGYLMSKGDFVAIDVPGAVRSTAFDINERGDIIGAMSEGTGPRASTSSPRVFSRRSMCQERKERLEPGRQARLPGSMRRVKLSVPIEDWTARLAAFCEMPMASPQLIFWTRCPRVPRHQPTRGHRRLLSRSRRPGPRLPASSLKEQVAWGSNAFGSKSLRRWGRPCGCRPCLAYLRD